jgi:transcriptional regulator with XRE-family HTH domain
MRLARRPMAGRDWTMKLDTKQVRQRRFQRALLDLGCSATELASKYGLPYRTVARWLAGNASPGVGSENSVADAEG